jgi:hypothetical protein
MAATVGGGVYTLVEVVVTRRFSKAFQCDPARDALDHHQGAAPKCRPLAAALRLPAAFGSE